MSDHVAHPWTNRRRRGAIAISAAMLLVANGAELHAVQSTEDHVPSPAAAFGLSLATTAAPTVAGALVGDRIGFGLVVGGLLFGPLSGYAYGDVMPRGLRGLRFRAITAGATTGAILLLCAAGDCGIYTTRDNDLTTATVLAFAAGFALVGGSAAIDVLSVPHVVGDANEAAADRTSSSLSLAPIFSPADGGTMGLAGAIRF